MVGPYTQDEIEQIRSMTETSAPSGLRTLERVWLATVDARDERIAALEGEVERLRGMLDYLAPVDKNGKMHLRDGRGDLSVMDTWLWRRVQNATLRGGKE